MILLLLSLAHAAEWPGIKPRSSGELKVRIRAGL